MIYGIDLGTTNSLLALKGELITGLVASAVDPKNNQAGNQLRDDPNATRSFKVNMSLSEQGKPSIHASALVLLELVRLGKEAGHDVKDVIISVPAYFNDSQRQATVKAAELAKLNVKGLINEPTAAAIALGEKMQGLFVVFDLGGGTFDVSIVDSRFGNYDVIATDGIKIGGDDLDNAIAAYFIQSAGIKLHKMTANARAIIKLLAEQAKRHIVNTDTDYVLDLANIPTADNLSEFVLTRRMYNLIVRKTFNDCIIKLKELVYKYIPGESYSLIFVGGSTKCKYLREFAENEVGVVGTNLAHDPDTTVALGASIYADMVDRGEAQVFVSDVTKALSMELNDGTVRVLVPANTKLPFETEVLITNAEKQSGLIYNLYQGDSILAKNNEQIGQLRYPLGKEYEPEKFKGWATISVDINGIVTIGIRQPLQTPVTVQLNRIGG